MLEKISSAFEGLSRMASDLTPDFLKGESKTEKMFNPNFEATKTSNALLAEFKARGCAGQLDMPKIMLLARARDMVAKENLSESSKLLAADFMTAVATERVGMPRSAFETTVIGMPTPAYGMPMGATRARAMVLGRQYATQERMAGRQPTFEGALEYFKSSDMGKMPDLPPIGKPTTLPLKKADVAAAGASQKFSPISTKDIGNGKVEAKDMYGQTHIFGSQMEAAEFLATQIADYYMPPVTLGSASHSAVETKAKATESKLSPYMQQLHEKNEEVKSLKREIDSDVAKYKDAQRRGDTKEASRLYQAAHKKQGRVNVLVPTGNYGVKTSVKGMDW